MTTTPPATANDLSGAFSPELFERGWRLYGARLDQALGSYREHRDECDVCPDLQSDAFDPSDAAFCSAGLSIFNMAQQAHLAFRANAIEQGRGSFVGLSDGTVRLVFPKEPPRQAVLDPDDESPLNWLAEATERHAFHVMLQYAAWGYDRIDTLGWSGEPAWKQVSRNLGFAAIAEKARAVVSDAMHGEATDGREPNWAITEAQMLYELALHLYTETGEMRKERERSEEAAQAANALAKAIKAGRVHEGTLIKMVQQRDSELLSILDDYEPGTATRVLALSPHYQRRVWWVLNGVEFTRPETAPYEALASGAY